MPVWVDQHRTQLSRDGNLAQAIYHNGTLATGESHDIILDPPGTRKIVITGARYEAFGGEAIVKIYRNPTESGDGTDVNKWFYKLDFDKTPELSLKVDPTTISDVGELGISFRLFSTVSAAGATTSALSETAVRVLNSSDKYLIRLEAVDNNVDVQLTLEWAEL